MNIEQTSKSRKILENFLIVIALIIISYILFPSIVKIYNYSLQSTNVTNTNSSIIYVRNVYSTINLYDNVKLPFRVEFNNGDYIMYEKGEQYNPAFAIPVNAGKDLPKSGYIEISEDGKISATNLNYNIGNYVCNLTEENHPVCTQETKD